DLVGRIGGDEFVILATGLDRDASVAYFERVRAAVDAPYPVTGLRRDVTASLGGVARVASLAAALARADAALYPAKQRGGAGAVGGSPWARVSRSARREPGGGIMLVDLGRWQR